VFDDTTHPRNHNILDGLGQLCQSLRDFPKALAYYDQAVGNDPGNIDFLLNRALTHREKALHDKQLSIKQKNDFNKDDFQYHLGHSISDLKKSLEISEDNPKLQYCLGISLYISAQHDKQSGKIYKECVKTLKDALQNHPSVVYEPDLYYHIGLAYCQQEKFEKAIYPFSKCIEHAGSNLNYHHERAKAY